MRLQTTVPETSVPQSAPVLWPDAVAFREAIQNPQSALSDPGLKQAQIVLDRRGLPLAYSGRFAVVFRLRTNTGDWALRCFTGAADNEGRRERYTAIVEQLKGHSHYFVPFRYLEQGIKVGFAWYPVVVMRWAEGETLGRFVDRHHGDAAALHNLCRALTQLLQDLEAANIAHGDWQHDNLLVSADGRRVTLVDYDGMFVPRLAGRLSPEIGHPNYQHPARNEKHYGVGLDRFGCLVLQTALLALAKEPSLWTRMGDEESLLFKRSDFVAPKQSPVFDALRRLARDDGLLNAHLIRLEALCVCGEEGVLLGGEDALPAAKAGHVAAAKWWQTEAAGAPSTPERSRSQSAAGPACAYISRLSSQESRENERKNILWMQAICATAVTMLAYDLSDFSVQLPIIFYVAVFHLFLSRGYESWPRKKIQSELARDREKFETIICERRGRTAGKRWSPSATNPAEGGSDVPGFVASRLKQAPIRQIVSIPGIGPSTVRLLRASGIETAADLRDRSSIAGLPPHQVAALQNWCREREVEAADQYRRLAAARPGWEVDISPLEEEAVKYQRERDAAYLEELHREWVRYPDASFTAYLHRILGFK
jgi:serine/threonine protein kinase